MKITIMMTVYNTAPFLPAAIESVLNQTVKDFEFLIIDDGSTDDSPKILRKYAEQDPRIRLVTQENAGCAQVLNVGLELTDTEWVFRFDSDDLMYPDRLEKQIQFIESHPGVKLVSCIVDYIDEHGGKIMTSKPVLMSQEDWQYYYRHCQPVIVPHTGAAIHRKTALELGGYNYNYFCDTYLFSRMMEAGHLILVQPEILGAYRVHSSSIMSRNVFWGEVGGEWIHDNWQRRRSGKPEIDWVTYQNGWRGWRAFLRPNRLRLLRARIYMREIVRLMRSRNRLKLGANLCGLCLTAPDYLLSRLLRRYIFSYRGV